MKSKKSQIAQELELLASVSNKLTIRKNKNSSHNTFSKILKLQLLHYGKNAEKKYIEDLINLIQNNNHIVSDLKLVYGIFYKDKLDQQQVNRKVMNIFKDLKLEKDNKQVSSYKNTENINRIYQLYQLKYQFNE